MNLEEREMLGVKAVFALVLLQTQQLDRRLNKLRVGQLVVDRLFIVHQLVPGPTLHRLVLNCSILQHAPKHMHTAHTQHRELKQSSTSPNCITAVKAGAKLLYQPMLITVTRTCNTYFMVNQHQLWIIHIDDQLC